MLIRSHESFRHKISKIWALAADDFFPENHASSTSSKMQAFSWCRICIITLECGTQIMTIDIKIRSDLASFFQLPPIKLRSSLPNPLASLMMQVLSLVELQLYDLKTEAEVKFLIDVRKSCDVVRLPVKSSNTCPSCFLLEVIWNLLTRDLNQYVPFQVSFGLSVILFVVSKILHLLFMIVNHNYHLAERLYPKVKKSWEGKITESIHILMLQRNKLQFSKTLDVVFLFSRLQWSRVLPVPYRNETTRWPILFLLF